MATDPPPPPRPGELLRRSFWFLRTCPVSASRSCSSVAEALPKGWVAATAVARRSRARAERSGSGAARGKGVFPRESLAALGILHSPRQSWGRAPGRRSAKVACPTSSSCSLGRAPSLSNPSGFHRGSCSRPLNARTLNMYGVLFCRCGRKALFLCCLLLYTVYRSIQQTAPPASNSNNKVKNLSNFLGSE